MEKYAYLINVSYLFIIWLTLYFRIPTIFRKPVVYQCSAIAFIGLFIQYHVFYYDWAGVVGILGTRVGIEDFFFVFSYYALTMTLNHRYLRHLLPVKAKNEWHRQHFVSVIFLLYIGLVLISYFVLDMHSFTSTMIPMIPSLLIAYYFYPQIIPDTMIVGGWLLLIGISYFALTYLIYPEYLDQFWRLDQLPIQQVYYGMPVMDIIWFFAMGVYTRILQSLWAIFRAKPGDVYDRALRNA